MPSTYLKPFFLIVTFFRNNLIKFILVVEHNITIWNTIQYLAH